MKSDKLAAPRGGVASVRCPQASIVAAASDPATSGTLLPGTVDDDDR
jgi:hypothetical protein